MTEKQIAAVRKLREADLKDAKLNEMQRYLATYITDACALFCEQSEDFAEAVMQEDKSLAGCIRSLKLPGRGLGYCSAFDVYRMAAQYFFLEADVELSMKISMPAKRQTSAKILDLKFEDLFNFGGGE